MFNEERVVSNTMPSHCLVQWVSAKYGLAKAEELYAVLNQKHFVQGQRLNDAAMLATACNEACYTQYLASMYFLRECGCCVRGGREWGCCDSVS